jgi:hypothetical protein
MNRDELTAMLEWMQAMQDGWKATNSAVLSLAQTMSHYQLTRRLPVEQQRTVERLAEVEDYLRKKLEAVEVDGSAEPLPLRTRAALG